jgi:hypothetical protein
MQAHDIWGREIVNQQAGRVIIPTADLLLQYLEMMKSADNVHIDWAIVGSEAVKDCQNFETLTRLRDTWQFPRHMLTDHDLEEGSYICFVLGLARRLNEIGFYTTNQNFFYHFEQFLGDDMILKCHVLLPVPGGVTSMINGYDRMRIASLFQGH